MPEDFDNIDEFEARDTAHKLPLGWVVLYIGLILWGIFYVATYLPALTGWTQEGAYEQSIQADEKK